MRYLKLCRLLLAISIVYVMPCHFSSAKTVNTLYGQHIRLVTFEYPPIVTVNRSNGNESVQVTGLYMDIFDTIANQLGFTYSFLPVSLTTFGGNGKQQSATSYIMNGEADWIFGALVLTESRNNYLDFPYPMEINCFSLLIPWPEQSANLLAPAEPFALEVWILSLIMAIVVVVSLYLISRYVMKPIAAMEQFSDIDRSAEYVSNVILSQGGVCYSKRLAIRLVAGVWCLAAFVLVNAYSCTLTSFVSAPNFNFLVNSIYELPMKPHVQIVIDKGLGLDAVLSNVNSGVLKYVGDMVNRDPSLKCTDHKKCLEAVRSGSTVYSNGDAFLFRYISQDLKNSGECRYTMAKDKFLLLFTSFALPKNAEHTDILKSRIIRMWDVGLIQHLTRKYTPIPTRCLNVQRKPNDSPRLNLKQLSGAFVLLVIGYTLGLLVFLVELVVKFHRSMRQI